MNSTPELKGDDMRRMFFIPVFSFVFFMTSFVFASETVSLPEVQLEEGATVAEAIYSRRSVRSYSDEALSLEDAGQILWAAEGKTVDGTTGPTRAYPSAGGVYPLNIYFVAGNVEDLDPGVYQYNWREHSLLKVREGDVRDSLSEASMRQPMPLEAPGTVVVTADFEMTASRYGQRGRDLYVPIDTGHLAQNISLQAESLGLGSVMIGAFDTDSVKEILGGIEREPVYIIPVGKPRG